MAFFKTSKGVQTLPDGQIDQFEKQAAETCQSCGRRKVADQAGTMVCGTPTCEKAKK